MKLIDQLRNAKEQSKEAAHRVLERARRSGRSLERHLRQKMRIYPRSLQPASPVDAHKAVVMQDDEVEETVKAEFQKRQPIVSIYGEDIEPGREDRRKEKPKSDRKIA
ncbi:MAG TPA: hypothetical protein VK699_04370 [Terriglobales bacterium]|jgi:hypothetical protein|nr:hypothetical protein [Terriglobales bacterium]